MACSHKMADLPLSKTIQQITIIPAGQEPVKHLYKLHNNNQPGGITVAAKVIILHVHQAIIKIVVEVFLIQVVVVVEVGAAATVVAVLVVAVVAAAEALVAAVAIVAAVEDAS